MFNRGDTGGLEEIESHVISLVISDIHACVHISHVEGILCGDKVIKREVSFSLLMPQKLFLLFTLRRNQVRILGWQFASVRSVYSGKTSKYETHVTVLSCEIRCCSQGLPYLTLIPVCKT